MSERVRAFVSRALVLLCVPSPSAASRLLLALSVCALTCRFEFPEVDASRSVRVEQVERLANLLKLLVGKTSAAATLLGQGLAIATRATVRRLQRTSRESESAALHCARRCASDERLILRHPLISPVISAPCCSSRGALEGAWRVCSLTA